MKILIPRNMDIVGIYAHLNSKIFLLILVLDQVMELPFAGFEVRDRFSQVRLIAFRIERVYRYLERYALFSADFLCEYRERCAHG